MRTLAPMKDGKMALLNMSSVEYGHEQTCFYEPCALFIKLGLLSICGQEWLATEPRCYV